jgi:cytoskeletal protein RodZ
MRKNNKELAPSEQQCLFVGDSLKQARKSKKLEIEDVAQQLYVNPSIINHLEEENFDQIGAEVFITGHLKNYARFLGLPAEKMLATLSENAYIRGQEVLEPKITDHLVALKIIAYVSVLLFLVTLLGMYISHH